LGFLGAACLSTKTKDFRYWISLDFLGFSRPKRDLSMGCAGFSRKEKIARFPRRSSRRDESRACGDGALAGLFMGRA
jgi:hypothetical protein